MSLLSYQLQIKRYQKELGLSDRDFNALDFKHNDINLLKQLQILNPIITAPPTSAPPASAAKTGFWGTFQVTNQIAYGSSARYMDAYLAYNNVPLTPTEQITGGNSYIFNIVEADRLPLPSSTLQLIILFQSETQGVNPSGVSGFEPISFTENPLDEENTLNMLVDANNYDDGECAVIFEVTYVA